MVVAVVLAGFHYLALGIGLGGLFMRGRSLRRLAAHPEDPSALSALFAADNFWGAAAVLWILTGLLRAFAHVEKAPDFYLRNGLFWVKMGLFLVIFALEILPMVTFIRWRIARKQGRPLPNSGWARRFIAINDTQTVLLALLPFVAAGMARGLWLL